MIMCVLLCYPVSIRIYYQQGVLFLVVIRLNRTSFSVLALENRLFCAGISPVGSPLTSSHPEEPAPI